jgi:AGZA family xanthine/uracil permease-like MFS transporter
MGAGAGYAVATGLFVGLGGILGYLPLLVDWIPAAAVAPILIYIGIEVLAQAFTASPSRHAAAASIATLPSLAFVAALEARALLPPGAAEPTGDTGETLRALTLLGNGFIITAVIWGAATADLIDRRFVRSALAFGAAAVLCLFGVIHSSSPTGTVFLPWPAGSSVPSISRRPTASWRRSRSSPGARRRPTDGGGESGCAAACRSRRHSTRMSSTENVPCAR